VAFLVRVAGIVHNKYRKHPDRYHQDLPLIAVAELCQQHCLAGNKYTKYEFIFNLKQDDRHFLVRKFMEVLNEGFDRWATRICAPYENVDDGNLNVYLSERKKPHLVSLFHIVYQSTRLHHVFPNLLALLMRKGYLP